MPLAHHPHFARILQGGEGPGDLFAGKRGLKVHLHGASREAHVLFREAEVEEAALDEELHGQLLSGGKQGYAQWSTAIVREIEQACGCNQDGQCRRDGHDELLPDPLPAAALLHAAFLAQWKTSHDLSRSSEYLSW